MPGVSIGTVSVSVVPAATGFGDKLRAQILPGADAIGAEVGRHIADGINAALRDIRVNATVDLDTSAARAALDELGAKSVSPTVGLDDTRIVAALEEISAKLDQLDQSVTDVRLTLEDGDIGARLDDIALKLDDIGSRDAQPRLSLDDSSFNRQLDEDMAKLSAAGSASASPGLGIGSGGLIAGGILGGLTAAPALPGALAGGGAAIGTLGLAMQGIGPALSAYTAAQTAAGTATGKTGAAAAGAAAAIGAAQGAVSKAETQAAHDAITSSESIKNAQAAVAQATQQAASAQISAEEQLANAQYAEKQAQQALTDARQQAILTLQQLHNAEADTALSAEQATLDLEQAKINEAATDKSATATALQKQQADLSVREAQQRLKEALEAKTNASNASNKADKEGVNGLPAVVAAQHNLAQAHQSVGDAQRNLVNAEQQGAAAIAKAQQSLADAVRNASWQQQSDALTVVDAQGRLSTAYGSAAGGATSASTAAAKYAQALNALSPAGQEMVKEIIGLKDGLHALEGTAQTAIAPGFTVFLEGVHDILPLISKEVGAMGKILGDGLAAAGHAMESPGFQKTLKTLFDEGNQFFKIVGPAIGDFLRMFAEAGARSGPAVTGLAQGLASIVRGLGQMVLALAPAAPAIGQLLAALGKLIGALGAPLGIALGEVAKAAAPVAAALAAVIAAIPPDVLGHIIAAILGVVVAVKLWGVAQGILNVALDANPIGLVVVAIAALGVAFYEAWQKSAGFRTAIKDIGIAFIDAGIVIVQANKMIIDIVLDMFSSVVHAAATAFGWVPGIGSKLKGAAAAFDGFKLGVDKSIDGVTDKMRGWRDSLDPAVSAAHDLIGKITTDFGDQQKAAGRAKTALDAYTTAIKQHGAASDQAKAARQQLITDLINAGVNADTARNDVARYTTAVQQNGLTSDAAKTARQSLISDIFGASSNAKRGMTDLNNYTTAVQKNGSQSDAAKTARAQLIKDLENSGLNAKTATGLVDGLGTSIKNLPAGKNVNITMNGKGTFTIKDLTGQGLGVQGPPPGVAKAARGMYVATGTPGVDDQLILAQRGELVVPTPIVSSGAVDHLRGRIPGFAEGGVVGGADTAAPPAASGNLNGAYVNSMYKTFQSDMTTSMVTVMRTALKAAEAAASGGPIVAFAKSFLGKIPYVWGGTSLGPAGADCCIIGSMYIQTPRGPKQIRDVVPGDEVYSWADGKLRLSRITRLSAPRHQMTYRLRTNHREIIASGNHPFLVVRQTGKPLRSKPSDRECSAEGCTEPGYARTVCQGHYMAFWRTGQLDALPGPMRPDGSAKGYETAWVELDQIRRGDVVVALQSLPDENPVPDDEYLSDPEFLWLLGFALGDGHLRKGRRNGVSLAAFGDTREIVQARLADYCGKTGTHEPSHGIRLHDARLAEGLRRYGLERRSTDREVPPEIWTLPHGHIKAFLDGYTTADGHTSKRESDPCLAYKAASRELIEGVRNLHLILGHNVTRVKETRRTRPVIIKGTEVRNARSLWCFEAYPTGRKMAHNGANMLRHAGIAELFPEDSRFMPQRVLAVEMLTEDDTYDITVEDTHNFVAEGLVVHNSGFTQAVYGHYGIGAPRTSEAQGAWVKKGPPTPGGLAFYHSPGGGADPGHVAIVANAGSVVSQGGGMGPQMRALKYMPLLWTGTPPGGFHGAGGPGGGSGGNGAADGSVISPTAAAAQTWMKAHMANYGWGAGQWPALQQLWSHESGWRWNAQNPSSPAYGIPQADPGSKMAADGADWRTNSVTQMKWGAEYIKDKYTTPSNAWYLWQARSPHWYDEGGWLPPGLTLTHNNTGRPEPILSGAQWDMLSSAVAGGDGAGLHGRAMAKRLDRMIHLLEQAPGRTGGAFAEGINSTARGAVTRAYFRTR